MNKPVNTLNTILEDLEKIRAKKAGTTIFFIIIFVGVYILTAVYLKYNVGLSRLSVKVLSLPFFLLLYRYYTFTREKFSSLFYEVVSRAITSTYNSTWSFLPDQGFDSERVYGTTLVEKGNRFSSTYMIKGTSGKTLFSFSEIKVLRKNIFRAAPPKKVFHGLFFAVEFNKHAKSTIYIRPRLLKDFGSFSFPENREPTDSEEFDKRFACYCHDSLDLRYILSPALLASLLELEKALPDRISLCIKGKQVYMALKGKKTFLEPPFFVRLNIEKITASHNTVFKAIETVIDTLHLNRKLWTR